MARPFRQQIDEGILDRAAALFAQRGFAKTSVADVAAAVGLSKAGLLHHYPSKEALHDAVRAQAEALGERALAQVRHLPAGAGRDRRALEALVDVALDHPGLVALLLAPALQGREDADRPFAAAEEPLALEPPAVDALTAFAVDPRTAAPERVVRVVGALSALAVLTLAAHSADTTTAWRPHIVATCFDALGHRDPGPGHGVPTARAAGTDRIED